MDDVDVALRKSESHRHCHFTLSLYTVTVWAFPLYLVLSKLSVDLIMDFLLWIEHIAS